MRYRLFIFLFFIFTFVFSDQIILQDGQILKGKVTGQDGKTVTIETTFSVISLPKEKVKEIVEESPFETFVSKAQMAMRTKNYEKAIEYYAQALKENPEDQSTLKALKNAEDKQKQVILKTAAYDFEQLQDFIEEDNESKSIDKINSMLSKYEGTPIIIQELENHKSAIFFKKSQEAYERINYKEALTFIKKALQIKPANEAYHKLELDILLKQIVNASIIEKKYMKLLSLNPNATYLLGIAKLYYEQNQYENVIKIAETHSSLDKKETENELERLVALACFKIAEKAFQKNEIALAQKYYLKSLTHNQDLSLAYLRSGKIYYDQRDYLPSRNQLQKGMKLLPNNPQLYYLLGKIDIKLKEYANAEKYLIQANQLARKIEDKTLLYDILISHADLSFLRGATDLAISHSQEAIELSQERYPAYYWLGRCYNQLGQIMNSNEALLKALELKPGYSPTIVALAENYLVEKRYEEAKEMLFKLLDKAPDNAPYHSKLAEIYFLQGKYIAAEMEYNRALENDKGQIQAYLRLADIARIRDDYEQALKFCDQALTYEPNNNSIYLSLGILYHTNYKNFEKAIEYYNKYYELGGNDPKVRSWIKECEGELRNKPQASSTSFK